MRSGRNGDAVGAGLKRVEIREVLNLDGGIGPGPRRSGRESCLSQVGDKEIDCEFDRGQWMPVVPSSPAESKLSRERVTLLLNSFAVAGSVLALVLSNW